VLNKVRTGKHHYGRYYGNYYGKYYGGYGYGYGYGYDHYGEKVNSNSAAK
jgi:hypothetical protein